MPPISMRQRRLIVVLFAVMLALVSFSTILSAISEEKTISTQQIPLQPMHTAPIEKQVQPAQVGTTQLRINTLPRTIVKLPGATNMDWGDIDGDGDLDLAVPVKNKPSRVFLNDNGVFSRIAWTETVTRASYAAAWGDVDGDGDLDLAIGNLGDVNNLYINMSGTLQATPVWTDTLKENTRDLKWGDMNGDGRLDLIVGNQGQSNHIFANEGGMLAAAPSWSDQNPTDNTLSIDIADMNGDQFLDFAVGNDNNPANPSVIYANAANGTFAFSEQVMQITSAVSDIAWGDINHDGFPELALVDRWFGGIDGFFSNISGTIISNFPEWQPAQLSLGWSVAWGDADNDGDLDLAIGSSTDQKERVYLNSDGQLDRFHSWESKSLERGENMIWVDFDQDDDQDLIVRYGAIIKVYVNHQWPLPQKLTWQDAFPTDDTSSIALGDMNNDGFLDMAVGNFGGDGTRTTYYDDFGDIQGQPNRIYVNSSENGIDTEVIELSHFFSNTTSVAWGDVNGDGFLDLAVGNLGNSAAGEQNLLYVNKNGTIEPENAIPIGITDTTRSLAWGDFDQDGDLDLAVGNDSHHPNKLYINEAGDLTATEPITFGSTFGDSNSWTFTTGMAWGDVDSDGDLDLAVSNFQEPNRLYFNDNGRLSDTNFQLFGSDDPSLSVAWGDVNGDGRLDLAVGNSSDNNQLYLNIGGWLTTSPSWSSFDADDTQDVAWGDVDGDGDLDLAAANRRGQGGAAADKNVIYVNQGGVLQTAANSPWTTDFNTPSNSVVWGDLDNDGDLDLVFGNERITDIYNRFVDNRSGTNRIYWNERVATTPLRPNQPPAAMHLTLPSAASQSGGRSAGVENGRIAIQYTLTHPENRPYRSVRGLFSLDGGGSWAVAKPVSTTLTTNITTTPGSNTHIFTWDVLNSNIFGRSNNVIFRLEAFETANSLLAAPPNTYTYTHQRVEAGQRPFIAANTTPFPIEGNQIRVFLENSRDDNALTNALVYQIPDGNILNGSILGNLSRQAYRTDSQGYLQGRSLIQPTDQLVALWPVPTSTHPISFTNRATLYYISATPITSGLKIENAATLTNVQSLVVSPNNPLIVYDLVVSLEWDASYDVAFMESLEDSFQKASEILFDVTNGQVMLGRVNIFHRKAYWNVADIVILANNGIRPSAAIGGVVNRPITETILTETGTKPVPNAYVPGQIRMGTAWDPFGENTAELTEDWYRALAHELSHYYFFLPDDYLGLKGGVLRRVNCQGSFMTTTRDPGYSEFLNRNEWQGECLDTLAENTTGRTDWDTIKKFYPMLNIPNRRLAPNNLPEEDGPRLLPLNLTHIVSFPFVNSQTTLPTRIFEVRDANNERTRLPNGQAYLIQTQGTVTPTDDLLIALGAPTGGGDRLRVRGAFPGDRLYLFDESTATDSDNATAQVGIIDALNNTHVAINVRPRVDTSWQPHIQAKGITSRTVAVTITQSIADGEALQVQLYPAHYGSYPGFDGLSPTAIMSTTDGMVHTAVLTFSRPSYQTAVRAWVDDNSLRETITQFTLNPPWPATTPASARPNNVPLGGPNNVPLGGTNTIPVGNPNNVPFGGPNNVPLGGPNNVPLGGPNNVPLGGPNNVPLGGPNNVPLGGPNNVPLGGPNNVPLGGPNNVPLGGPNNVPLGGPNNVPLGGPNNVPLGGAKDRSLNAPILSADAQVIIYNNQGFFEDNGVDAMQVLPVVPEIANHPWLVPVGQAYHVTLNPVITDSRSIAFSYLQRDVPNGYEHTLSIYYLPDEGEKAWQRITDTQQYPENLVVTPVKAADGIYAVMSTIEMPPLSPGWNLLPYPLPVTRTIETALRSISGTYSIVYDPMKDGENVVGMFGETATSAALSAGVAPTLTALTNLNIRTGPGTQFTTNSYLLANEPTQIQGQDAKTGWWLIQCPARATSGPVCWVSNLPSLVSVVENGRSTSTNKPTETNFEWFEFGRVYWIKIESETPVTPYLAPPIPTADGGQR